MISIVAFKVSKAILAIILKAIMLEMSSNRAKTPKKLVWKQKLTDSEQDCSCTVPALPKDELRKP